MNSTFDDESPPSLEISEEISVATETGQAPPSSVAPSSSFFSQRSLASNVSVWCASEVSSSMMAASTSILPMLVSDENSSTSTSSNGGIQESSLLSPFGSLADSGSSVQEQESSDGILSTRSSIPLLLRLSSSSWKSLIWPGLCDSPLSSIIVSVATSVQFITSQSSSNLISSVSSPSGCMHKSTPLFVESGVFSGEFLASDGEALGLLDLACAVSDSRTTPF
mmetsp:Transcript_14616/g.27919  ORF Transcript_14616/g.27919 Transcript_14616/m.27919 type:complete len:223 (-) Transcript_14616:1142-1810(-)